MGLILLIALVAAIALGFWRSISAYGGEFASHSLDEYRRVAGIVNASSYALALIFDAISLRRAAQTMSAQNAPVVAAPLAPRTVLVPQTIGRRADD